ncbi:MAG: mannosyltransferase [Blastocatellia bacterium]
MSDDVAAAPVVIDRQRPRLEMASTDARAIRFSKASGLVFALIVVLFAVVRFAKLTAYGLFSDEVFSAETIHRSWPQMQRAVINDIVHPPLFYYLLKAWIVISDSLLWMKLFPVLLSLLAIIPFVLLGRELKLRALTINLALFLMAVNEYLINYAQELRMYSLLLLLVTASMWLFAKLGNARERALLWQLALLATNLLMVYTHYYGWLIVAGELLFLIARRRDRLQSFSISLAALVAGFFPWTFAVMQAAYDKGGLGPNLKWNTRPTLTDFFQHYVTLNGPVYNSWRAYATVFSTVIFFTPILLWARHCLVGTRSANRTRAIGLQPGATTEGRPYMNPPASEADQIREADGHVFLWLTLLALLPSVIAFVASYLLAQSVWGSRFLIVVAPAYLLLVALAATTLQPRKLRFIAVSLIAVWATLSGALQLTHRDKISWQPLVERMIQQETNQSDGLRVYTRQGVTGTTIQYYLDQASEQRLRVAYVDDYSDINAAHFWIAFIRYRHDTGPLPLDVFAARGDRLGEAIEADAPGHKVIIIPVWRREGTR